MIGRTLSHYRVVEALGAGGMGEVYRARDEKLGRDVALKFLPADSLADEGTRRRLRKEAEALVRLSHPHIATLHDVDSAEGVDFLVMELVRGPTLEERLREGPLPEKEVVELGTHLLHALVAAHGRGVVHRDLKPSNLALTEDGLLKVLDFGVARLRRSEGPVGDGSVATETVGQVVGSPPYMSPEQLRGRGVDQRTDVYAAGAVLFELVTGQKVFGKRTGVELTDAILHEAPLSPRRVLEPVSPALEAVILKALDKDPGLRYQTAREMLVDLERLQVSPTDSGGPRRTLPAPGGRRPISGKLALAMVAVLALAAGAWLLRPLPPPRITNFRPLTAGLESGRSDSLGPDWASDGTRLYYFARQGEHKRLYQMPIAGGGAAEIELPLTDFRELSLHGYVVPESALLLTGATGADGEGQGIWLVPVPAGAARRVAAERGSPASSPDGEMLAVAQRQRILLLRRDGSLVREIAPLPTDPIARVTLAPDGRRLRYEAPGPDRGDSWIWEVPVEGGETRPLWQGQRGQWTPDGRYFLFDRFEESEDRHDLYAAREGQFPWPSPGEPMRLTSGPLSFHAVGSDPDGTRLFAWGVARRGELLRYDEEAGRFEKYLGGMSACYVDASPDGKWVAWVSFPDEALWRSRVDGSERLRLTGPGWRAHLPRWSPGGRRIVFAGRGLGEVGLGLYIVPADGGQPEVLVPWSRRTGNVWDPCWLPDGRSVVFSGLGPGSSMRMGLSAEGTLPKGVHRVDLGTGNVTRLPGSEGLVFPKCSPRGEILAYSVEDLAQDGWPYWVWSAARQSWESIGRRNWAYPNWSRSGETITALNQDEEQIERWSRTTGRVEVVAHVDEIPLGSWFNASWIGLTPDGSPLVMRDRSSRGLYALEWEAP